MRMMSSSKMLEDVETTTGTACTNIDSVGSRIDRNHRVAMKIKDVSSLLYALLLSAIFENFFSCVASEFTYGYETDDYTLAFINITYTDTRTGRTFSEEEEIGKFSVGKVDSVNGIVVHVSSNNHTTHDGCYPLDSDNIPHEPWIALLKHGQCQDSTKIRHVALTNASAAVVYSDKSDSKLIKMYPKVFNLVSIFTTKEKGEKIANLVDNGTRVMMYISVGTHNTFRYANINRTSVLFVSVSFIILMLISLAWLIFYYIQRFRYIHTKDLLARRLCNAARRALDKIPTKTLKQDDKDSGEFENCCAVCIESFKVGEIIRTLPCTHTFHKLCIDPWLLEQRSCPMCKMDILKYFGLLFSGSRESIYNLDILESRSQSRAVGERDLIRVPIYHSTSSSSSSPSAQGRNAANNSPFSINHSVAIVDNILINPTCSSTAVSSNSPISSLHWNEDTDTELFPVQDDTSWIKPQKYHDQSMQQSSGTTLFLNQQM